MSIQKIEKINQAVDNYFSNNPSVDKKTAKVLTLCAYPERKTVDHELVFWVRK